MMNIDIITLEDGIEYEVIDALSHKDNDYLILQKKDDERVLCARKVLKENDEEYLVKLDNDNEFTEIMELFYNRHKGDKNEK